MMKKHVDADAGRDEAGGSKTTGPNQHTQPNAFANDERDTEKGNEPGLSESEHAFSPCAFPCANHAADEHINAKAPSRKPDRHEERYWQERTASHQDHGRNREH